MRLVRATRALEEVEQPKLWGTGTKALARSSNTTTRPFPSFMVTCLQCQMVAYYRQPGKNYAKEDFAIDVWKAELVELGNPWWVLSLGDQGLSRLSSRKLVPLVCALIPSWTSIGITEHRLHSCRDHVKLCWDLELIRPLLYAQFSALLWHFMSVQHLSRCFSRSALDTFVKRPITNLQGSL